MSNKSNASSGGIGLSGAVFIVFLVLKLTGNIDWSWWWVTSPLWIPLGIVLSVLVIMGVVLLFTFLFSLDFKSNRKPKIKKKTKLEEWVEIQQSKQGNR